MDFPLTPRALLFRFCQKIKKTQTSNNTINRKLFNFYLKYGKPQYESWTLKRIVALKVGLPVDTKDFPNINFKRFCGSNHVLHEFTLDDFPFMNPYDWISIFNIVAKDVRKYQPIFDHLKKIIKCYILEFAKMYIEIASVLNRKPIMKPFEELEDIHDLRVGLIDNEYWSIMYKKKEDGVLENHMFFL